MEYKKPNWFKIFCKIAWKDLKFIVISLTIAAAVILCILSLLHYPVYTLIVLFLTFGVGKWIKKTNEITANEKRDCCRRELDVIAHTYRDPANKIYDIYMKNSEVPSDFDIEKYKTYKEKYSKEVERVLEYYHLTEDDVYIKPIINLLLMAR